MTVIQLNNLEGLVTFPSFHTANAILFAWALWTVPYLRWVGLVVNGLMILSTPLTGAHYIIDVVAGTIVAVAAIAFARFVGRVHGGRRARVSRGAERSGCIQVAASPPL
jgi:membrane-associated phospholipid phosphatase